MAATDREHPDGSNYKYGHTHDSLKPLVMAMEDYKKNRGKKTLFGKDKGAIAYKKFEDALRSTLLAMIADGEISKKTSAKQCQATLVQMITVYAKVYPIWMDAYSFSDDYFIHNAETAETAIHNIMLEEWERDVGVSKQEIIEVHVLDPSGNYVTDWTIGEDIPSGVVKKLKNSSTNKLYAITAYEARNPKIIVLPYAKWVKAKTEYDAINIAAVKADKDTGRKSHNPKSMPMGNLNLSYSSNSRSSSSWSLNSSSIPNKDTIYINENTQEKTAILISENQIAQMNGATFVTLMLLLISDGWKSGTNMFNDETGFLDIKRHEVPDSSAKQLAQMLMAKIDSLPPESRREEFTPIMDLLRIAKLGAFTIDLVDN